MSCILVGNEGVIVPPPIGRQSSTTGGVRTIEGVSVSDSDTDGDSDSGSSDVLVGDHVHGGLIVGWSVSVIFGL